MDEKTPIAEWLDEGARRLKTRRAKMADKDALELLREAEAQLDELREVYGLFTTGYTAKLVERIQVFLRAEEVKKAEGQAAARSARPAIPEGWVLVPREPTEEMRSAWIAQDMKRRFGTQGQSFSHGERQPDHWELAYHTMLTAAPSPTVNEESK